MIRADDVQTGEPPQVGGRYLVFTRCASSQISEWVEPTVATWHSGNWHIQDGYHGTHIVIGWIGPIAPMKAAAIDANRAASPPSYDL